MSAGNRKYPQRPPVRQEPKPLSKSFVWLLGGAGTVGVIIGLIWGAR